MEATSTFVIKVHIGDIKKEYIPYVTQAPQAYDGFGTFSIYNEMDLIGKPARLVLIELQHLHWQITRYASGSYISNQNEIDSNILKYITDKLYERLLGEVALV